MALIEHLEKLRHFHKVAAARSFSEAALLTGVSQAGLSKSIAALESVLEVPLFVRTMQGLILTKEGQLVLQTTKRIMSEATGLESDLRSLKAAESPQKLRIGMYDSIAVYFFNDLVRYLHVIYKKVEIELIVQTSSELARAVQSGDVDLAVGVNFDAQKAKGSEFFALFEDHYSFYITPQSEVDPSELPLILHPFATDEAGQSVESHLSAVIKKRGAHRAFNFETIKALTTQGMGIGVLPTQVAKPLVQQRLLVPIEIARTKHFFGKHRIGFLATPELMRSHREFAMDLYRLGQLWSKS